ncbi:MAG: Lrp/AsnC family transcriptional regulator [Tepidibacter sp.]|jgi:DNA-binding Lrp family transcriptional regulator|uniref:siroheme decarboxylase subunit alpha n=1 Tax=Tepidibacter sp. TaxID=2529387 RepID=UPI0025D7FB0C|nr:Lrp/AsnC family transcriptional regulator [Tepidibacter sp.]MCT4509356.1 Lrp/AsnC family transcriptional regulator [Tepidibacter sp.]
MDSIDKLILNEVQDGIPLEKNPFKNIAIKLNITEDEIIRRINKLKQKGYIRRFGGIFDSQNLGIKSTLVAVKTKDIENTSKIINEYSGVTHNYQRDDEYNIWFTLMASSKEELENIFDEIKKRIKCEDFIKVSCINKHKVKVYLDFDSKG